MRRRSNNSFDSNFDKNFNRGMLGFKVFGGAVAFGVIAISVLVLARIGGTVAVGNAGTEAEARSWATTLGLDVVNVSCAGMDTDGDGYVSCTVSSREGGTTKLTAVECSVSYMPDGCRIQRPVGGYNRTGY
jgi:hypothetical protein